MNFVLGMFRPLTGAVFGVLLFMFLKGGLLTFAKDPPNGTDGSLYYGSLAFIAGFSERAAQVVVDTGARMLGAGARERSEAPK